MPRVAARAPGDGHEGSPADGARFFGVEEYAERVVMMLGGLGFAFVSEFSAQGLSTPESVERRRGLPVLTTISLRR